MQKSKPASYRSTVCACYLGNVAQAVVVNLTPILFIPLRTLYGLSFTSLGVLVLVNFTAQVLSDLIFSHAVDKYGYRVFMVAAGILNILGLGVFLLSPQLFPGQIFAGLLIGTILFSVSGGLMEVLLSPMINAIPTPEKNKAMNVLHSFYSWGQLIVVLFTTLLVYFVDAANWQWIAAGWLAVPISALVLFLLAPMPKPVPEAERESLKRLQGKSLFFLMVAIMIAAGASEQIMAQWSSSFLQVGMNLPKILGDGLGVCTFALMMALGRLAFGKLGNRLPLAKIMLWGGVLAVICYFVVALSPVNTVAVVFCGLTGIGVALLWPGTICLASERYPRAGTWMFAFLACGGDIGAAVGPFLTGAISDGVEASAGMSAFAESLGLTGEQLGLRAGLLCSAVFPILIVVLLAVYMGKKKKSPIRI